MKSLLIFLAIAIAVALAASAHARLEFNPKAAHPARTPIAPKSMRTTVRPKTVTVTVKYPDIRVVPTIYFIIGYGPMAGPTGSIYNYYPDGSYDFAYDRLMSHVAPDTWSVTLSNVFVSSGEILPFYVFAVDAVAFSFDETGIYPVGAGGQGRMQDCLLNHDAGAALFISFGNHNTTMMFSTAQPNVAAVTLYPYFCGDRGTVSTIFDIGNGDFMNRNIPVLIPNSMLENTIPRNTELLYVLDGAPAIVDVANVETFTFLSGKEVVIVGIPPTQRAYEFIPFTAMIPPYSSWDFLCYPCANRTLGGGAKFAAFIRGKIESAVMSFLGPKALGVTSRTLFGFSLSGLEAFWIATHQTSMFDYYLVGSPSLWFNLNAALTEWTPASQFPLTKRISVFNCMPDDATTGGGFDMVSTARVVMDYEVAHGNFVPEVNFKYFQVGPTLHSAHCARLGFATAFPWLYAR